MRRNEILEKRFAELRKTIVWLVIGYLAILLTLMSLAATFGYGQTKMSIFIMSVVGMAIGATICIRSEVGDCKTLKLFGKLQVNSMRFALEIAFAFAAGWAVFEYFRKPYSGIFATIGYLAGSYYAFFCRMVVSKVLVKNEVN